MLALFSKPFVCPFNFSTNGSSQLKKNTKNATYLDIMNQPFTKCNRIDAKSGCVPRFGGSALGANIVWNHLFTVFWTHNLYDERHIRILQRGLSTSVITHELIILLRYHNRAQQWVRMRTAYPFTQPWQKVLKNYNLVFWTGERYISKDVCTHSSESVWLLADTRCLMSTCESVWLLANTRCLMSTLRETETMKTSQFQTWSIFLIAGIFQCTQIWKHKVQLFLFSIENWKVILYDLG